MTTFIIILAVITLGLVVTALIRKRFISAGLWILTALGTYLVTSSIVTPISFEKEKDHRYAAVIENLDVIADMQKLHRAQTGKFANSFDELYNFVDNGKVFLTQTRTKTVKEYSKAYRIDIEKEVSVTDTISVVHPKDQLISQSKKFEAYIKKHNGDYKSVKYIPITIDGQESQQFEIAAGTVKRGENNVVPVFEVKVRKDIVLADQNKDLVNRELISRVGVRGEYIKLGDINIPTSEGNWPKLNQ